VWRPLPFRRFVVSDTSMQPALRPGDRILVWQWPGRLAPGDIVVFVEPDRPRTISVKRLSRTSDGYHVRGDNVNVSRDSRDYGAVPRELILGRAVYRYLPGTRRGRL
jgi:nickel-type superoxide dismutase maturation protease